MKLIGDQLVRQNLNQLRGPHQFAPHVALNVLADGCERALERDLWAGQCEANRPLRVSWPNGGRMGEVGQC